MADPRNELADIVVPLTPALTAGGSNLMGVVLIAGLTGVICMVLAVWWWRRGRSARTLKAITAAVMEQQDTVSAWAGRLDTWARNRFRLTRLDANQSPPGLDVVAWHIWVNGLAKLRFAPESAGEWDELAALCQAARLWASHA